MPTQQHDQPTQPGTRRKARAGLFLLPAIVLICGLAVAVWMMQSGPKAKPRQKVRNAVLVDVRPVEFGPQQTTVSMMGTVRPKRQVELKPQVSGKILALGEDLVPGGLVRKGDTLLTIDPRDYELTVKQLENEVSRAEADLRLERGRQRVARKEYQLLGEDVDREELALMLREPQMASASANLDAARIKLEQARLNLQRTRLTAPFNAVVISRDVNTGTSVSPATSLATLVGTDSYWVEAAIPVSQLQWINPGNNGKPSSAALVHDPAAWGNGRQRVGRTAGLTANLEEQGRMARLLVEVSDPLSLSGKDKELPPLLLNSYVRVEVAGQTLPQASAIERSLVRDGNQVWVMDANDRLDIRAVEIAFRTADQVLVTGGLQEGERLVTSNLPSPVHGMALRLADAPEAGTGKDNH